MDRVITWRYATSAICLGLLIVALSLILSGRVVFGFFPAVEGDRVYAALEMPEGVPAAVTLEAARKIERAARCQRRNGPRAGPSGSLDQSHLGQRRHKVRA